MSRPFRLGFFMVSALAIFALGVFLIGDRQFLFSRTYELSTAFTNVSGLIDGAEVRVGGINRGTVTRIDLPAQPGGQMTVLMRLDRATLAVLRTDSVASIETDGLLGDKHIEITFGSSGAAGVGNGVRIAGSETPDLLGDIEQTAAQLKEIGTKINAGEGTIGALVNDRQVYDRLQAATTQAQLGATAFQDNMQALKHNFLLSGFFNRRGYDDSSKLTEHEVAGLPQGPFLKKFVYDGRKLFGSDVGTKLKQTRPLDEVGRTLEGQSFGLAVVVAQAGMKGDSDAVRVLTQARAMNVRDYLVQHFKMDDTRLKTMGLGKDEQGTDDGGSVAIVIYRPGVTVPPAGPAAPGRR